MRKLFLSCACLLAGCAAPDYRDTPSNQLCMAYMTLPSVNLWQPYRADELARRGEDCSQYASAAAVRQRANAAAGQALQGALRPPPEQTRQGTHTYFINGKYVTCTTSGNYTNCF